MSARRKARRTGQHACLFCTCDVTCDDNVSDADLTETALAAWRGTGFDVELKQTAVRVILRVNGSEYPAPHLRRVCRHCRPSAITTTAPPCRRPPKNKRPPPEESSSGGVAQQPRLAATRPLPPASACHTTTGQPSVNVVPPQLPTPPPPPLPPQPPANPTRLALPPKRQCSCGRRVELALRRLARNPAIAKKLILAVHPDKCPAALSDSATELFRLVLRVREANGHANT